MEKKVSVLIVGEDCRCETDNDWHKVAGFARDQLEHRFPQVEVSYITLDDARNNYHGFPNIGPNPRVPLVFIDGDLVAQGHKLPLPLIAREVESRLKH